MSEPRVRDVLVDPIVDRNPITFLMLGICSALAVTTRLETAIAMALSVMGVMVGSSLILSLIRHHVPDTIRIFAQISIIASLVIAADQLLQAYFWSLSKQLSVFVSLIVTNCIVMGRTEGFALKHPPLLSVADAVGHAAGYGAVLLCIGFTRELLGTGRVFGHPVLPLTTDGGWYVPMRLMGRAPVAFILIALLIFALNSWKQARAKE